MAKSVDLQNKHKMPHFIYILRLIELCSSIYKFQFSNYYDCTPSEWQKSVLSR